MTSTDRRLWTQAYRKLRLYVLARDGHVCQIRGPKCTQYANQVDHIVSRSDGGEVYDPANLRAACRACNARRGAQQTNEKRRAARYRTGVPTYETRM